MRKEISEFPGADVITDKPNSAAGIYTIVAAAFAGLVLGLTLWSPFADEEARLGVLRVGVEPDQSPEILRRRYAPLIDYLAAQTGLETRLVIPTDYAESRRLLGEGQVDIVNFGGLSFVETREKFHSSALVMREIDTRFTTWFLTRPEFAQSSLNDMRGKTIAFGSRLSTSGHLMPRYFLLQQWKINPENYFAEVRFSGTHDRTVQQVRDGEVDLGAANSAIVRKMIADGRVAADDIRVMWQTPPYPDYVWTVRQGVGEEDRTRIRDAFMRLDIHDPVDSVILTSLDARSFLPANPDDFEILRDIATRLDILVGAQ